MCLAAHERAQCHFTPLLMAVKRNSLACAKLLLQANANPNETVGITDRDTNIVRPWQWQRACVRR